VHERDAHDELLAIAFVICGGGHVVGGCEVAGRVGL